MAQCVFNVFHSLSLNHFKLRFLFETSFTIAWNVEMVLWFKHREIQKLLLLDFTSSAIKNSVCGLLTTTFCLPETRFFVKKNENFYELQLKQRLELFSEIQHIVSPFELGLLENFMEQKT